MNTIYFDSEDTDDLRRERLYAGQLYVYKPTESSRALCAHARAMAEEAFAPLDPRTAQDEMAVEDYASLLASLKPEFIHHPKSKELIQGILEELGCDLQKTHFDVPRLRTSTSDGYLTSGIAYAFKPHRDTWYSTPQCQLNWWLPVYPIESDNAMAFHTRYWDRAVHNDSSEFNYQEWGKTGRKTAAQHIKADTRKQTVAQETLQLDPQLRVITRTGGVLVFSAAHLHSSVPNTSGKTRLSIDFRTVHLDDLITNRGAPNIDSSCTGTTIRDYLCAADLDHLPDEVIARYEKSTRP